MSKEQDSVAKGVSDAWDFWLSQHDVSVPETIEAAAGKAFDRWLTAHSEELIAAIAETIAKQHTRTHTEEQTGVSRAARKEDTSQGDLYSRAARIFGTRNGQVSWPYGLSNPPHHLKRENPEQYERLMATQAVAQRKIIEWAERHGLKASSSGCCPKWLQRGTSRRCAPGACTLYGSGNALDQAWLDHSVQWLKDGKPTAITTAPYSLSGADTERIAWWLSEDQRLRSARGAGWYGHGTVQVVLWRSDRIATVTPAS